MTIVNWIQRKEYIGSFVSVHRKQRLLFHCVSLPVILTNPFFYRRNVEWVFIKKVGRYFFCFSREFLFWRLYYDTGTEVLCSKIQRNKDSILFGYFQWVLGQRTANSKSFLEAFAKFRKATVSLVMCVCPFVCPCGRTRLPLDKFLWNLIFDDLSKICPENWTLIKISHE